MWRQAHFRVVPVSLLSSLVVACLVVICCAGPARAEVVEEVWRSSLGAPRAIAVNPADRSLWVAAGGSISHLSAAGDLLSQTDGFGGATLLAVSPFDGSCWVARSGSELVHVAANGAILWRSDAYAQSASLSASPLDGSCWLIDAGAVVRLAPDGRELARLTSYDGPSAVSVGPADGTVWLGVMGHWDDAQGRYVGSALVRLDADGVETWREEETYFPSVVAASPIGGSCWLGDGETIVHMAADGAELARVQGAGYISTIAVDPAEGSCWAGSQYGGSGVTHVAATGAVLWQEDGYLGADSLSADPGDGSAWMVDVMHREFVHRAGDGGVLPGLNSLRSLNSLSVNPLDGSCWVHDGGQYLPGGGLAAARVRFDTSGAVTLWETGYGPGRIAAGCADGSYWLVEHRDHVMVSWTVAHRAADDSLLWSSGWSEDGSIGPIAIDRRDGSLWAVHYGLSGTDLIHWAADGTELWRSGDLGYLSAMSVNATDGSVWVSDVITPRVIHFAADGAELWRSTGFGAPVSVSVDSRNDACWVADASRGEVVHLAAGGAELWRGSGFFGLTSVSANSRDGSCWVSCSDQLVHLNRDGAVLWTGGAGLHWATASEHDGSCWAADLANAQLVRFVATTPEPPVAGFSASTTHGPAPLAVQFTDTSLGYLVGWRWTFGDGRGSGVQHPVHEYIGTGPFTVTLTTGNDGGNDTEVKPDYITIQTWLEEDDPAIAYAGAWSTAADATASGGLAAYSAQAGASVTLSFYGTGIRWHTLRGPQMGKALFSVDGRRARLLDLYRPQSSAYTLSRTGLRRGRHSITITVTGLENPSSTGARVALDALEVVP